MVLNPDDTNGFRLARMRLTGQAETRAGNIDLSTYVEVEVQPDFFLADAFATATRRFMKNGRVTVDVGQMRVPISRQNMLSDSRLAFVDKAQLATIAPDRDLGLKVTIDTPRPPPKRYDGQRIPGVRLIGGVFNGEGPNQVENLDENYFHVARGEVTLVGQDPGLAESAFGGRFVTVSGSYGRNKSRDETVRYAGIDIAAAYRGVSASYEYLKVKHRFVNPSALDFDAKGWALQLNVLLPPRLPPHRQARLELGLRLEEIDRNDTAPISIPGDPTQSVRAITAVASYYLRMHTLKAQLALTSFEEKDDRTATGENATFDNNQLLIQVTYRME